MSKAYEGQISEPDEAREPYSASELGGVTGADERGVRFERQGVQLAGILARAVRGGPRPAVILLHGFISHKNEDSITGRSYGYFAYTSRRLTEAGFHVLRFDFNGHGESDGEFAELTMSALISDTLAAVEFMAAQPGVDPDRIGLVGTSMGGLVAASSAARDSRIRSIVLWNAPPHPLLTFATLVGWERITEALRSGSTSFPWETKGQVTLRKEFFEQQVTSSPLVEIAKYKGAMLVVVTRADPYICPQPQMGQAFINAHGGHHKLVEMDGDHTFSVKVRGTRFLDQAIRETANWFEQTI